MGSVPGNSFGTFTSPQPQDEAWTSDYEPGKFLLLFPDLIPLFSESFILSSPQFRHLAVWLPLFPHRVGICSFLDFLCPHGPIRSVLPLTFEAVKRVRHKLTSDGDGRLSVATAQKFLSLPVFLTVSIFITSSS